MEEASYDSMEAWIASRPESVQKLARRFPINTQFHLDGVMLFLVGYTETDQLIVSKIDPNVDYDASLSEENKSYIHVDCIDKHMRKKE